MGDLISRSALLNAMDKRYNEKKDIVPNNLAEGFMQMEKLIKEQPTAYDVEGVINKLEELDTYKEVVTSNKHPFSCSEIETISKSNAIALVRKGEVE